MAKAQNTPTTNKDFWNRYASDFDAIYGTKNSLFNRLINQWFRQCMRMRFEQTVASIPENAASVIDIGCGPGHYSFALAEKGVQHILGIDFSEEMVAIARSRLSGHPLAAHMQFDIADINDFQPTQTYEYSIMMGFLEYFGNADEVLKKVISFTTQKVFASFPADGGVLAIQRKIRYKRRCALYMYTEADLRNLLAQVTDKPYSIERLSRDFFVTIDCHS